MELDAVRRHATLAVDDIEEPNPEERDRLVRCPPLSRNVEMSLDGRPGTRDELRQGLSRRMQSGAGISAIIVSSCSSARTMW
jgi:hypothetical protein